MRKLLLCSALLNSVILLSSCGNQDNVKDDFQKITQDVKQEVSKNLDICIGVECRLQPTNVEEYIPIFTTQIQQYNTFANSLWLDNAVKDITAIAITMDRTKAWKILPNGSYTSIPMEEADSYGKTLGYDTEFMYFTNNAEKGIILTINEDILKNPESFKKYAHLGTYDLFITYVHELFHEYEQGKWLKPENIVNAEREEFLEVYEARALRGVIFQQLLNAFIYPEEETNYIKKAVATYREYQKVFPEDAANTQYWDKIEGTAYYIELISSLKVGYPQLQNINDIYNAYGKIAKTVNITDWAGAVNEGYVIGGLAGFLLDHLSQTEWKKEVMQNVSQSPIEILAGFFDNKITSQDIVVADEDLINTYKELANQKVQLSDEQIENIVNMFKQFKESDVNAYNVLLENFKAENPELIEKILPLLE